MDRLVWRSVREIWDVIRFGVVGSGWRAQAYARVWSALPDLFSMVGVVTRSKDRAESVVTEWHTRAFLSLEEMLAEVELDFVVVSVPRGVVVGQIRSAVALGVPVLCETPPAPDLEGLRDVANMARHARIQIAEQYPFQPWHAARLGITDTGTIGEVSMAWVSFSQEYHALSVLRRHLGVRGNPATVRGSMVRSMVETGGTRAGPRSAPGVIEDVRTVAILEFDRALGVFDFAENQHRSYVRRPKVLVRGSRGEVDGEEVHLVRGLDEMVTISLRREEDEAGGHYLKGISGADGWVWRNPFPGARLADDELALATCLERMAGYASGSAGFYSVADAAQDCYLGMLISSAAESGEVVRSEVQPWSEEVGCA